MKVNKIKNLLGPLLCFSANVLQSAVLWYYCTVVLFSCIATMLQC